MALQPGNPVVGGIALRRPSIRSPNFIAGSQGWTVNADGSAEFDNLTVRGKFDGTDYEINSDGIFFYSGTPALGNLIVSITSRTGTDAFGNAFEAGFVTYLATLNTNLFDGELQIGETTDDQRMILTAQNGQTQLFSGRLNNTQTQALLQMVASATSPQTFVGPSNNSPITTRAFEVSGSASLKGMMTTQVGGAEELTAHSLSGFATGFAVGGAASYRLVASPPNTVQIHLRNITYNGTGTSTDGAVILSAANGLPASYRPNSAQRLAAWSNLLRQPSAGVFEAVAVEVETDGSLQIFGLANGATRLDVVGLYALDM